MKGIALDYKPDGKTDLMIQVTKVKSGPNPTDPELITKGIVIADNTIDQDVAILLQLNQGDMKEDPLLGPNLIKFMGSNAPKSEILKAIKIQFSRTGINYEEYKERMSMLITTDLGTEEDITTT